MVPEAWPTWLVVISGAGVVASAMLAIVALMVKTGRGLKRVAGWLGDVVEERMVSILDQRHPTLSREDIEEIVSAKVAPIYAEVRPNGGSSLKDQVTDLQAQLRGHIGVSTADRASIHSRLDELTKENGDV